MFASTPTRTQETEDLYNVRFPFLSHRVRLLTGDKRKRVCPSVEQFAAFLIWVEANLSKSTLRSYRSVIKFGLQNEPNFGTKSVAELTRLLDQKPQTVLRLAAKVDALSKTNPWGEVIATYKKDLANTMQKSHISRRKIDDDDIQNSNLNLVELESEEFTPENFFNQVEKMVDGQFSMASTDKWVSRKKDVREKSSEKRGRHKKAENEKRTSAKKTKRVDKDIYDNLKDLLVKMSVNENLYSKSQYCKLMLVCSTAYGLRPSEWANSRIENGELVVRNGKFSNGRANGPSRTIPIAHERWVKVITESGSFIDLKQIDISAKLFSEMTEDCLIFCQYLLSQTEQVIERNLDLVDRSIPVRRKQALQLYLKNSSEVFKGTKPKVSIYSGRHQFSANAKSLFPPELVGDLMGHEDEKTCQSHYARKTLAHQVFKDAFGSEGTDSSVADKFKSIRERSIENKEAPESKPQPK